MPAGLSSSEENDGRDGSDQEQWARREGCCEVGMPFRCFGFARFEDNERNR